MNFQFHKFPLISWCFYCQVFSLFLSRSLSFIFPYPRSIASPLKKPSLPPFSHLSVFRPNKQWQKLPSLFFFLLWTIYGSFFDLFSFKAPLSINWQLQGLDKGIVFWTGNFTFQCRYPRVFRVSFRSEISWKLPPIKLERPKTWRRNWVHNRASHLKTYSE